MDERVYNSDYYQYASDVVNNRIVACKYVKLACARFLKDLDDDRFEFKPDEVQRVFNFYHLLRHFSGSANNKRFVLEPWESWIVAAITGFYWKGSDRRRTTLVYLSVGRKQGKTALMAGLMLYYLLASGEPQATCIIAANSAKQANQVDYSMIQGFLRKLDPKNKLTLPYRNGVRCIGKLAGNSLDVLANSPEKADGYNCYVALLDEIHEYSSDSMKHVLRSGMGNRKSPLLIQVTTRGFDDSPEMPCKQEDDFAIKVLEGEVDCPEEFCVMFCLDDEDDREDESVWVKAMPNIGNTVSYEFIRGEMRKAAQFPSEVANVEVKYCNRWHHDSAKVWIPDLAIKSVMKPLDWEFFRNKPVTISLDLASVTDMTSISVIAEEDDVFYCKSINYIPSDSLRTTNENMYRYERFVEKGCLTKIEGNVTDYNRVFQDIKRIEEITGYVRKVYYDKWNSTHLVTMLTDDGFDCEPVSQSLGSLNIGCKEFERRVLMGKGIVIDDDSLFRWCAGNARLRDDIHGNISLVKDSVYEKIDALMACVTNITGLVSERELLEPGI